MFLKVVPDVRAGCFKGHDRLLRGHVRCFKVISDVFKGRAGSSKGRARLLRGHAKCFKSHV